MKRLNPRAGSLAAWLAAIVAAPLLVACNSVRADDAAGVDVDYHKQVQPIFNKKCYSCHGPEMEESDLRLDRRDAAMRGGVSGAVIVPGKSDESRIIHMVIGDDDDLMPPDGNDLTEEEIGILKAWIDAGANWPDDPEAQAGKRRGSDHWSLQPIQRGEVPKVSQGDWVRNPIDNFVLARLEAEKIEPSPEADRYTLLRRVHLDLTGLPPTPEEIDAFINDERPDAYERVVDRLLDSPHYGERWARHWLDLARYADSDGYEKDRPRPHAWRYRHWVIDALNADMPFDQFTIKQLAGDLLPEPELDDLVAVGFHRNTLHNAEGGSDREEDRTKKTVDRADTLGTVWLGLTVGCANCHTHKYDPISQREFFGLYGFFNNIDEKDVPAPLPGFEYYTSAEQAASDKSKDPGQQPEVPPEEEEELEEVKAQSVVERKRSRPNYIHVRGDFLQRGALVEPHTPEVLPPLESRGKTPDRLDLAHWLVSDDHPLTARVTANRIWQRYFGRGIVATSDDFGTQGELPSHPQLLDWLAAELRDKGWSLKQFHRLIVTSATYRQSSAARPELYQRDPYNALLARQTRKPVEAEIVRDLALTASGLLAPQIGGPSVHPPQPAGLDKLGYANQVKWVESQGKDRYRRGLYTFFQRTVPYPMLVEFGSPDSTASCVRREKANTPTMALTLWNDPVFFEMSQSLGRRVIADVPSSDDGNTWNQRARRLIRLCLSREPSESEIETLRDLYGSAAGLYAADAKRTKTLIGEEPLPEGAEATEVAAWITLARAVMNVDEFVTRE